MNRPGIDDEDHRRCPLRLDACLEALRSGDMLVLWELDRRGPNLRHQVDTIHDLTERGVGLEVLTGRGSAIDTTTPAGQLVLAIFAALAEHGRSPISERTIAGLTAAMAERDTSASHLCAELGISRQTLYRSISPTGRLCPDAHTLLAEASTGR